MSKSLKKLIDINRLREFKNKLVGTDSAYVQTGEVDQTVGGTKAFSKPIVGSVTGSSGSCTGNAATATQFSANATVALTGDATGTSAGSKKGWSVPVTLVNSGVTAGAYGPSADVTGNNNATISVPEITVDAKGRITSVTNRTLTCKNNTYSVYNKTLTIQKNGTKVATFTSNSNTDVTANITVPTKTSELTNDSGYLTSHQSLSNYSTLANTIKSLSISGKTITYTKGDNTTGTLTTQDTNTDTLMTQNVSTTNSKYPILLCPTADAAANQGAKTGIFGANALINPSTGEIISKSNGTGAFRVVGGNYGFFIRNDGSDTYFLLTASKDQYGTWTSARPLTIHNANGLCSISGNAATATKLAAKRTIALSGAATGTATGFDGSGNITIPVTALASSAIRAQWYAAYPDGAEAHNAMWGGRDITAAFVAGTVSEHIADGTFKDIFPGDYITKQVTISGTAYTVNWVVADCDYWWYKGDQNNDTKTHHVVIVPQQPIYTAKMNATNTTEGGYKGSAMYQNIIPAVATGLIGAFGSSHILKFRDAITNRVDTGAVSSGVTHWTGASGWWGEWADAYCNLMSEKMVYGAPITASGAMDNTVVLRQMSAFRLSERAINYNRAWYWLRDVVSSAYFAVAGGEGYATANYASAVFGVRPFALLR